MDLGLSIGSVQVNLTGETGDMGVLANHEPFIEQLKPGLLEVMEESGGNKKFFRSSFWRLAATYLTRAQCLAGLPSFSPTLHCPSMPYVCTMRFVHI